MGRVAAESDNRFGKESVKGFLTGGVDTKGGCVV